jgi:uncharacterized protein (DUF2235 family)
VTTPDEATNVVRMAQTVKPVASNHVEQVVYYNAGVGSGGPLGPFVGRVFGAGLRNNVKRFPRFRHEWAKDEAASARGTQLQ